MKKIINYLHRNVVLLLVIVLSFILIVIFYSWGKEDGCYAACTTTSYPTQCHLFCDNHSWNK